MLLSSVSFHKNNCQNLNVGAKNIVPHSYNSTGSSSHQEFGNSRKLLVRFGVLKENQSALSWSDDLLADGEIQDISIHEYAFVTSFFLVC